jgi:two-component system cell cycle response regulator
MSLVAGADIETVSIPALLQRSGQGALFQFSVRAWQIVAIVGLGFFALHAGLGLGGPAADHFVEIWVYFGLEALAVAAIAARAVLVPSERVAWAWLAAGLAAYSAGDLVWTFAYQGNAPIPSIADPLYLLFYPASYIALLLLVRSRLSRFNRSIWLDGVTVALAAGAAGAAFLLEVALDHTEGEPLAVATNLAYPLGDVVLLALVVGVFSLVGRDAGLEWAVIGGAFIATAVADAIYLWMSAVGTYQEGSLLDVLWPLMGILLAIAAWVRPGRSRPLELEGRPLAATPIVCTVLALAVFVDDHFRHLNEFALVLASATIVLVLVRTLLTFRENTSIAASIKVLSVTDPLTHLWNRRKLADDLEDATHRGTADPHVLVLYDLNGFKRFNDLFGHPVGDSLLMRLAAKLRDVVDPVGTCYRLGGDEFCVLARVPEDELAAFLAATEVALSEVGEGFAVTTALGCAFLPDEASDPARAMQIADQRLYACKHHSLIDRGQPHGVLLQALYEREPTLRQHAGGVAALSLELGRRLRLNDTALEEIELAAQLHDIGKLAVPEAILHKSEPLSEQELQYLRRHTIIGERILSAAPALSRVGAIVRSTHEAFDGSGYPDGLAGADIPLAARIVAVCDTYSAITSDRTYQAHRTHDDALIELRAVAGSQLDPELVELFCATVAPPAHLASTALPMHGTG